MINKITQLLADIKPIVPSVNDINTKGLDIVPEIIKNVIAIALELAGIVAVIFIIVGGLKYVLSTGNPSGTKSAKDTIMYAVIGLVVVISTWAILNFVTGIFK